jgi:hypothetical protein
MPWGMIPHFHRAVCGRGGHYGPPPALGVLLGLAERAYDLRLPMPCNVTVARKCREDILVAEVLGPSLVLLGRLADLAAEKRQGFPKAMRVEVGQASSCGAFLKIARMGPALLQCLRSSPDDSKCRVSLTTTFVAGNNGSSRPQSFCRRRL